MAKQQKGFTLIELVVVIVILGILAATALPRFIDLRSDAETAALQGVVGALNSGFSVNYAGCSVTTTDPNKCLSRLNVAASDCNTAAGAILTGGVPAGYTVGGTVDCTPGAGTTGTCTVTQTSTTNTANATLVCTR